MPEVEEEEDPQIAQPVDPHTGRTFGDVVPARSTASSKIEKQVRDFLAEAGYPIPERAVGVLCHHTDAGKTFLTLTPDVVIEQHRLAIEVDPCDAHPSHRGSSHAGEEKKDRLRNELLEAVGWTVLRLRLGAQEGGHIGDRDVMVESSGFTKAAQAALVAAIEDFTSGRPATVRLVPKGNRPSPAKRRSHVVNIGLDRYSDDTYWFTWYPSLDSPDKYSYRLAASGRYLYVRAGWGSAYVAEVDLHLVDRSEWKEALTVYLADKSPSDLLGSTKWPWGPTLLIARDEADPIAARIIEASDHEKQSIDRVDFYFTVSGEDIAGWTSEALLDDKEQVLASIHPAAVEVGYRFAEVSALTGYRGPYSRIVVTRAPVENVQVVPALG